MAVLALTRRPRVRWEEPAWAATDEAPAILRDVGTTNTTRGTAQSTKTKVLTTAAAQVLDAAAATTVAAAASGMQLSPCPQVAT